MSITQGWTPSAPANGDNPAFGDDEFRALKVAIQQRLRHGGHEWETTTTTAATAGRHKVYDAGDSDILDATLLRGEFYIFDEDGSTKLVTFSNASAAAPNRFYIPTLDVTAKSLTVTGAVAAASATIPTLNGPVAFAGALTANAAATFNDPVSVLDQLILKRVTVTTGPYAVLSTDVVVVLDTNGGAITVNLPAAASNSGRILAFSHSAGAASVTIDGNGGETISGALTRVLNRGSAGFDLAVIIVCDGSNWHLLGSWRVP